MKLPEEAKTIEIFPRFQRWMKKTNFLQASYPEDLETLTFDVETQTGITECHIINNLLTELARAVLRNIDPRLWQYGPRFAQSVPPRPSRSVSKRLALSFVKDRPGK